MLHLRLEILPEYPGFPVLISMLWVGSEGDWDVWESEAGGLSGGNWWRSLTSGGGSCGDWVECVMDRVAWAGSVGWGGEVKQQGVVHFKEGETKAGS